MSNLMIVTLEEAKLYLRIDNDMEDGFIKGLIITAEEHIKNVTRSSLKVHDCTYVVDKPGSTVEIPDKDIVQLDEVKAFDSNGIGFKTKAFRDGNVITHTTPGVPQLEIKYKVYDEYAPEPLRQAALLLIAHLYENRGIITDTNATEIPFTFQALVAPYRKGFF